MLLLGGERTGRSGTEVARRLGVTQLAVSQAVKRGARIIEERHLKLKEDLNLIFYGRPLILVTIHSIMAGKLAK